LLLAIGFLLAFIWSIKDDQYDDFYTPAMRILFDNEKPGNPNETHNEDL